MKMFPTKMQQVQTKMNKNKLFHFAEMEREREMEKNMKKVNQV